SPEPEIGYFPVTLTAAGRADDLFRDMPPEFPVFQWHYDMFQVPPGAELLARSGRCPHQAFRLGRAAYGLQFHFEVTPEMVEAWLNEYNPQEVSPAAILSQAGAYADEMQGYAHTLCRNFLSLCRQQ
ncbi:MAG: type 1 glutamine amidotransferase, partial [Candidatus Omnitrophica bacterium]|nr:type 1 glutamine amidotransferase [Candidatus Omnitrophota bacterium]